MLLTMRLPISILLLNCVIPATRGFTSSARPPSTVKFPPLSTATTDPVTADIDPLITAPTTILNDDPDFVKPDPDSRRYRAIRLANGLVCLLVSSPDSDQEAGAVHVQAGHMDDPPHRPGLAHFHEHMLFLGTRKYPDETDYEAFLNRNGGSSNAYTDMEDTNYYFSVTPYEDNDKSDQTSMALTGALDRLAQFFIAPLFDASMVDRELRAIDSEYRNSVTDDAWRNFQLLKSSANPDHAFAKFGCGNYQTLTQGGRIVNATHSENIGSLPVDDLVRFWKQYYQTYNMRLAVVGRATLDALQETVEQTFGQLPHSDGIPRRRATLPGAVFPREAAQYGIPAFGPSELQTIRHVVPLLEARTLKLYFNTPPLEDATLKTSRPYRVLSHLLGHESPGSLHAVLNDEGLLTGLSSGMSVDTSDFSLFGLTINLTQKGMEQRQRVLDLTFQWIALIREGLQNDTLMRACHDELRQIADTNFRYRENGDATDFCSHAAELLFEYEPSQILYGSAATGDYDPVVAHAFLERLKPENALITIIAPEFADEFDDWQRERWYGAKYRVTKMAPEQIQEWRHAKVTDQRLQLPALNAYIPKDFSLKCDLDEGPSFDDDDDIVPPQVLISRSDLRMWHKMDRKWRVPKTFIRLSLLSPSVYRSPRTMTLNRIYERILNDDLNSFVYDAQVAGCNYKVSCVPTGLRISLRGYSEKLPFLLDTLTTRMLSLIQELKEGPELHPGLAMKFKKAHDNLLRETKNYRLDTPYEMASYNARLILEESVWHVDNYIDEMEGSNAEKDPLTMEECGRVAEESLRGRIRAEGLCIGNINEKEALNVANVVDEHFLEPSRPLLEVETPTFRSMKLPTRVEAREIFGGEPLSPSASVVYQEVAFSPSEENNALELVLQVGCDLSLGYEGVAILDMIGHLAYNSAYNQLRTKEQLGYIVSAFVRKVAGSGWSLAIVIQSSVALPSVLEERSEAWLATFRKELEDMSLSDLEKEAEAVVAQLLERDTKLSQEVSTMWGEILYTETLPQTMREPAFDRVERIAEELMVSESCEPGEEKEGSRSTALLKDKILSFFDRFLASGASERRALSLRVYSKKARSEHDGNIGKAGVLSDYGDIRQLKQFLSTYPLAPYWLQRKQ